MKPTQYHTGLRPSGNAPGAEPVRRPKAEPEAETKPRKRKEERHAHDVPDHVQL